MLSRDSCNYVFHYVYVYFSRDGSSAFQVVKRLVGKKKPIQPNLKVYMSRKWDSRQTWKKGAGANPGSTGPGCAEVDGEELVKKEQHGQRQRQEVCREQPFFGIRYSDCVKTVERVGWKQIVRRMKSLDFYLVGSWLTSEQVMIGPAQGECCYNMVAELLTETENRETCMYVHCSVLNMCQAYGDYSANSCWSLLEKEMQAFCALSRRGGVAESIPVICRHEQGRLSPESSLCIWGRCAAQLYALWN